MMQNPVKSDGASIFFLGIGAQKSGTSWLNNYLKSHPEVLMPPIKEMHFFGNRTKPNLLFFERQMAFQEVVAAFTGKQNKKRVKTLQSRLSMRGDIDAYKRYFHDLLKSEKAYGEISPSYAYMDKIEFIKVRENFSECKIIFLMRNPVDRAWSQMRFSHIKDTREELLKKALQRMAEPAYILRCDYKSTIETLMSVFPRNRIHFEFFEHLFTQEAVDGICDFLGVGHKKAALGRKKNVAYKAALPPELRREMLEILRPQYAFANRFYGSGLPKKWRDDIALYGSTP